MLRSGGHGAAITPAISRRPMASSDPLPTQQGDVHAGVPAELMAAGFADPEEIGRGGFGVVYRCSQPELDRIVAVKVLTTDLEPDNLERFVREQVAMGKLSGHPHIVTIFQVGTTATGRPYIVMQYHPHGSLEAKIQDNGPVGWADALHIGVKVAGALETAHRRETLHRDVKPANILLTEYGEPQLTDFGIARIIGGFETADGAVTGSPAYTAPEVMLGQPPDVTSDIYSLASTLFSAGTGHAVFERRKGEQMVAQFLRITKQPMPSLRDSGLPADVCAVIEQAMSRNIADRPATAEAFGEQLRDVQRMHGLPVDDMPVPIPAPTIRYNPTRSLGTPSTSYPARALTPPAPATRFQLPVSTKALVDRARLIDVLRVQHDKKLTVIHGPTGFGKSTLAAQWAKLLRAEGVAVAWLTVDHDDNNVVWFLSHLIEAIRAVTPALAIELGEVLEEHGDGAERYVLTSLINEIHETGTRMTLVIDDWQRVTDPATIAAMRYLLDNIAPGLNVLVTSRSQRGLPMSRMRMQDELLEIDAAALRFDVAESENFLVDLGGLDLDHGDVEELTAKTDGWVAALQLASLSLRGRDDPVRLIGTMTGRHHAISEFLAENVLDTLEPSMLDFLLATSITERICGDLATTLSGVPDGQAMLQQVEERDLFLRRIDEQWFRYHQLFLDFLRHRLSRDEPERVVRLHRAASTWFADNHFVSEAVDHALAAGDDQRAVQLVENDGIHLVANSQMATLIGLMGKLPAAVVKSDPRLQLALAWANIVLHRIPAAEQALALMESRLASSGLGDDEIADIRADGGVVRGVADLTLRPARGHRRTHRAVSGPPRSPASVHRRGGGQRGDVRRGVSLQPRRGEPDPGMGRAVRRKQAGHLQHGSRAVLHGARAPVDARHHDGGSLFPQGPQDRQALQRQSFLHGPAGELGARRIALRARRSRRGRPPFGRGLQARARGRLSRLQDRPVCHRRQDQGVAGRPACGRSTAGRGHSGRAGAVTEPSAGDGRARTDPPRASAASGIRCVAADFLRVAPPAGGCDRRDHGPVRGGLGHPVTNGGR